MTYVALVEAAALVTLASILGGLLRSQQRSHARREDLLTNQLLHAAGKTWQPAPATRRRAEEPGPPGWTPTPEQYPIA